MRDSQNGSVRSSSFEWTSFAESFRTEKFFAQHGVGKRRIVNSNNLQDPEDQRLPVNVSELAKITPLREIVLQEHENDLNYQSRDTLQSLVQSCLCGNHHGQKSHETSIRYSCDTITECSHLPRHKNKLMSKKSINDGNDPCNRTSDAFSEKASGMGTKARIRWNEDLHKKFIQSINCLGGARKATPKAILKLMKCEGLTIVHVKSHLQKYRTAQLMPETIYNSCFNANVEQLDAKTGMQIVEAIKLQIDVQRRLYEQLESQKKLQVRIEEQAKQLQAMIQSQMKTNDTSSHEAY